MKRTIALVLRIVAAVLNLLADWIEGDEPKKEPTE